MGGCDRTMGIHEDIMFWAFRYALKRHTYAVSQVASYLILHKDELSHATRSLIRKEIADHHRIYGRDGWQCDQDEWELVVDALKI